ncbi:MAG: hypothetical protein EP329_20855 [Deltaproteobacteria bacterium]|nr:MAG: hypothetical protein EP329_20855 [Deltaproteobacteria bacterium]
MADGAGDTLVATDTAVGPVDSLGSPDTVHVWDTGGGAVDTAGGGDTLPTVDTRVVDTAGDGEVVTLGCPAAVITVAEGAEVLPQTLLHLSGEGSHGLAPVVGYQWTVEQPSGAASVFLPSASSPNPMFEVNVAGTYLFHLGVVDAEGRASCQVATYLVTVTPVAALHIELLWTSPGDDDETDTGYTAFGESVGTDVDLHLLDSGGVREDGQPAWFDTRVDCYWQAPAPGEIRFDASLDRDDTDGAGPENINFGSPGDGASYRIGVHYWDDWGYGLSYATVRVYVHGALVYEVGPTEIRNFDLWEVGTIAWPEGVVTPTGGVTPDYPVPFF